MGIGKLEKKKNKVKAEYFHNKVMKKTIYEQNKWELNVKTKRGGKRHLTFK